jgi:1-acyl-sn-glycerol-3-phosphate acyltransferase
MKGYCQMSFYRFIKVFFSPLIRILFRVKSSGAENIPKTGAVILCSNHKSYLDPLIDGVVAPRPMNFMAKAELFKVPVLGFIIRNLGAFPVHRGQGDREALRIANEVLEKGNVLALYPEGTRLKEGEMPQKFKSGAARLAFKNKAPIVPLAIIVKGHVRLLKRTVVKVGRLITYEELGFTDGNDSELRRISEEIRLRVIELIDLK